MSYTADLTPHDAHALLVERSDAVLIDCRTKAEWTFVGVPAIDGARFVEWTQWPGGASNPDFISAAADGIDPAQPIVLLCRSGGRSVAAAHALTEAGFQEVYNVLEGFEGDVDGAGHRAGGWKGNGLPWQQA